VITTRTKGGRVEACPPSFLDAALGRAAWIETKRLGAGFVLCDGEVQECSGWILESRRKTHLV